MPAFRTWIAAARGERDMRNRLFLLSRTPSFLRHFIRGQGDASRRRISRQIDCAMRRQNYAGR